jgi:hypothetical protein
MRNLSDMFIGDHKILVRYHEPRSMKRDHENVDVSECQSDDGLQVSDTIVRVS